MPSTTEIATVCHEANRAICEAMGDHTQLSWDEAAQWQRDSAIRGVEFTLANPDASPDDQHNNWMADKFADAWTWGPVKNADQKTHHCLVPYEQLPFEQRVKDHVFRAIVKAMRFPHAS